MAICMMQMLPATPKNGHHTKSLEKIASEYKKEIELISELRGCRWGEQ